MRDTVQIDAAQVRQHRGQKAGAMVKETLGKMPDTETHPMKPDCTSGVGEVPDS